MNTNYRGRRVLNDEGLNYLTLAGEDRKTFVITPEVLTALDYKIPKLYGTVVFLGFDRSDVLKMPTSLDVEGDVWIISTVLFDMTHFKISGNLFLVDVGFNLSCPLYPSNCGLIMDATTFETYQEFKIKTKLIPNRGLQILSYVDLANKLMHVVKQTDKLDILIYLQRMEADVEILQEADGVVIKGDVEIAGPFQIDFADVIRIEGSLYIMDELGQDISGVTVTERLEVRSFL